jgi:Major Facilitator Superfamily
MHQQTTTIALRGRLGRRFGFAAAAFALAVGMLGTTLPTSLYELYRQQFGFSVLMITVIFATYAAGVITSLLMFGRLSDQIGRRRVLLPGLVLSALSAVCFLTATGLPLLLVGRVLSGLSAGIFTGTATATLIDLARFAVLGLFTAVTPAFLGEELGVTSRAIVGLVVFAVFAASTLGQLALELVPERAAIPAGAGALTAGMGSLAVGLAASSLALLVLGGVIAGFGQGVSFRGGLAR